MSGLAQGAPSREVPSGENYVAAFTEGIFPSKYTPLMAADLMP
jgi:hypothetical protein